MSEPTKLEDAKTEIMKLRKRVTRLERITGVIVQKIPPKEEKEEK